MAKIFRTTFLLCCLVQATLGQEVMRLDGIELRADNADQLYQFWYRQPIEAAYEHLVTIKADCPNVVEMRSPRSITLKPGFTVEKGAHFHGYIADVAISAKLEIDPGDDVVYCFDDQDVVTLTLGTEHTIATKHPEVSYTVEWYPSDFMDNPSSENPTVTLRKSDREAGRLAAAHTIMLRVRDNLGHVGIDFVTLADCDQVDPYTGLTFTNDGANIAIQKGTCLTVYGNIYNRNGGVAGFDNKEGKWINNGTIQLTQNWGNDATSTCFVAEYADPTADPATEGEPGYTGLVEFIGTDQTVYGTNTTYFNDLTMESPGVKHLMAETDLTVIKGTLVLNESEINCHTSNLRIDNTAIDAIQKYPAGKIVTYNADGEQGYLTRQLADIGNESLPLTEDLYIFPVAGYKYIDGEKVMRYRPVAIKNYDQSVFCKTSFVFKEPTDEVSALGPNVKEINGQYYYELKPETENGEATEAKMDIVMCTNPVEDGRMTAVAHLDDEKAYRSEEAPVWKYTGKIFYVPNSTQDADYATFEDFYECAIKKWTDFGTEKFTLIEAGIALFTDNLDALSYLRQYPSEEDAEQARIDAHNPAGNIFAPKTFPIDPDKPFTINLNGGENSTNASLKFYLDENLKPKEIKLDPNGDGNEYELSPDLVIQNDGEVAIFDLSKKPLSSIDNCSDKIVVELQDGIVLTPNRPYYNSFKIGGIGSDYSLALKVYNQSNAQVNMGEETGVWSQGKWECLWIPEDAGAYYFKLLVTEPVANEQLVFSGQFIVEL